jgi:hypothetical protein
LRVLPCLADFPLRSFARLRLAMTDPLWLMLRNPLLIALITVCWRLANSGKQLRNHIVDVTTSRTGRKVRNDTLV